MKWKDGLKHWRKERSLTTPQVSINEETGNPAIIDMLSEETTELKHALLTSNEHEEIDACADHIVLASNHIAQKGYDIDLVMKEVIKEISSRTGEINPTTGKWTKYRTPEAQAKWYKADYSTCKLRGQ